MKEKTFLKPEAIIVNFTDNDIITDSVIGTIPLGSIPFEDDGE